MEATTDATLLPCAPQRQPSALSIKVQGRDMLEVTGQLHRSLPRPGGEVSGTFVP